MLNIIVKQKIKSKTVIVTKKYFFLDIINLKYILYKIKIEINVKIVKVAKIDYPFYFLKCQYLQKNEINIVYIYI